MPVNASRSKSASWRKDSDEVAIPLLDDDDVNHAVDDFDDVPLSAIPASYASRSLHHDAASRMQASTSRGFSPVPTEPSSTSFEMRSRTRRPDDSPSNQVNSSFVLVDVPVEPGDTLPSFAIKYHVTVNQNTVVLALHTECLIKNCNQLDRTVVGVFQFAGCFGSALN